MERVNKFRHAASAYKPLKKKPVYTSLYGACCLSLIPLLSSSIFNKDISAMHIINRDRGLNARDAFRFELYRHAAT